ncbi:MAG: hypothetical protein K2P49_04075, partial [Oscillospiraceae bacterium]|nr:hypothetical protein [Oscillospiraceae bacterium]
MKRYQQFMDGIAASDTLHRRLVELKEPEKRPMPWKKYASAAAALALVVGVGAYGLGQGGWDALTANFRDDSNPEIADVDKPDIATAEPGELEEPGTRTNGGYEVTDGGITGYFFLPAIEYGMAQDMAELALDWDLPAGSTRRDLTQEDIAALFGKEETLSDHLGWGGYELSGWAAWYEDGSFWGAFINGYKGPLDHFELAFTAGNTYPPTCIAYGDSGVVNELWDVPVTAWGHDGQDGVSRRVEFLHDGYGFRFDLTGSDRNQADNLVSRITRWLIVEGAAAQDVTADGAVLAHPWEADANTGVGEPNWDDSGEGWTCPDCGQTFTGDGWRAHVHSFTGGDDGPASAELYDPNEAADPSYNAVLACRTCGGEVPDGTGHHCVPDPAGGYVCGICGEAFPEGKVHSHELCV